MWIKKRVGFSIYGAALLMGISFFNGNGFASGKKITDESHIDFRNEMRSFVQKISAYAKAQNPRFFIIPQNGEELLTIDGEAAGMVVGDYVCAIDGVGREDLLFGYEGDDTHTPMAASDYMQAFLAVARKNGLTVLATDYCSALEFVDQSYAGHAKRGYVSFAADSRSLDTIPQYPHQPYNVHQNDVVSLADVRNFLYIINPEKFTSRQQFISAIQQTDYDLILIDLFCNDEIALTVEEVNALKQKQNGGKRLVICYMSIGEAETYRYYWQPDWLTNPPAWLDEENPNWKGNFKVRYWMPDWQKIIVGDTSSYLQKIFDAQFDGVYLDIIDGFWYYENKHQDQAEE